VTESHVPLAIEYKVTPICVRSSCSGRQFLPRMISRTYDQNIAMTIKKAVVIQWSGVGIAFVCSLVTPPFASTVSGVTGEVQWVRTTGEGCACEYVEVANRFFYFSGPTSPAGPGPSSGDTAEVTYLNVSTGPGTTCFQ